jgi:hypothetical protein
VRPQLVAQSLAPSIGRAEKVFELLFFLRVVDPLRRLNLNLFYASEAGHLQVQQIPWDSECTYRMPVQVWKALMDHHYPGTAWLSLDRELFDRLYAYRRRRGLATWDQAIEQLLPAAENLEVAP